MYTIEVRFSEEGGISLDFVTNTNVISNFLHHHFTSAFATRYSLEHGFLHTDQMPHFFLSLKLRFAFHPCYCCCCRLKLPNLFCLGSYEYIYD
jgi:hypothetical protein